MSKLTLAAGFLAVAFFAGVSLADDHEEFEKGMKELPPTMGAFKKSIAGQSSGDAVVAADKVATIYASVEKYWRAHPNKDKVAGAIEFSVAGKESAMKASALAKESKFEEAMTAMSGVQKTCAGCHAAYREKTESGYKFKSLE